MVVLLNSVIRSFSLRQSFSSEMGKRKLNYREVVIEKHKRINFISSQGLRQKEKALIEGAV